MSGDDAELMPRRGWPGWAVVAEPTVLALFALAVVVNLPSLRAAYYFNDVEHFNLPVRAFFGEGLRHGELRWWCSELGGGFPLFAEGQAGAAYPPNLLFAVLRTPWFAFSWSVIFHLFLAGLGVTCVLRQLGTGRAAALAGGVVYLLSAPVYFRVIHLNFFHGLCWLPWLLWGLERGVRDQRGGFTAAGVALAMQFLAGHSQPPLLSLLLAPTYTLARAWMLDQPPRGAAWQVLAAFAGLKLLVLAAILAPRAAVLCLPGLVGGVFWLWQLSAEPRTARFVRHLLAVLGVLLLGGWLAAVQLLPTLELIPHTARRAGLAAAQALDISLQPGQLASLLLPRLHGSPFVDDVGYKLRWGTAVHWEWCAHVGVLPAILLFAAPWLGRRRERWLGWGLALGALALALGQTLPFYNVLRLAPGWHSVRGPARVLGLFALGAALTTGLVLDDLSVHGLTARTRRWLTPVLLATAGIVCVAGVQAVQATHGLFDAAHEAAFTSSWVRAAVLVVCAVGLLLGRTPRPGRAAGWGALAAVLVMLDLISGSAGYHRLVPPAYYQRPEDADRLPGRDGERLWVDAYRPHPLRANRSLLFAGVDNATLYTPLELRRWKELFDGLSEGLKRGDTAARRWLALYRVGWVEADLLADQPPQPELLRPTLLATFDRAWVTPRWIGADSAAGSLDLVTAAAWRPEAYSIIESPAAPAPRKGELSEILWSEFGRHRVTCKVIGDSPRVLVLSQTWYPGWRVRAGTTWTAAEPVDHALCGVPLGAGAMRVDFVYQPMSLRLGLFLTLLAGAWLAALVGLRSAP